MSEYASRWIKETASEQPVSIFDTETELEPLGVYIIYGMDEATGETKGGRAYLHKQEFYSNLNKRELTIFHASIFSADELSPVNFILPFRNITEKQIAVVSTLLNVRFSKPRRALSIGEAMSEEGARILSSYIHPHTTKSNRDTAPDFWDFTDSRHYGVKSIPKGELFQVEDEEIEQNPDEYEGRDDNIVFTASPSPSILAEATGAKIETAAQYLKAIEKSVDAPLDRREKRAVISSYHITAEHLFLSYAIYEFFRTEDYSHLQEILSNAADFGLSEDWERYSTFLSDFDRKTRKRIRHTANEYVVASYLQHDKSDLIGTISYRELSSLTGIPKSLVYRAADLKIMYLE